jgi:hypothetical protein
MTDQEAHRSPARRLDLMTHCALRDANLFRRAHKGFVPGGCFESLLGIQRREARTHCFAVDS